MYRPVKQYHDIGNPTEVDPNKIPSYPLNDAMQSVQGRNLAGAAWDLLALHSIIQWVRGDFASVEVWCNSNVVVLLHGTVHSLFGRVFVVTPSRVENECQRLA